MKRPHWNKPAWKKPTWAGLKASLTTRAFRVGGYSVAAAAIVVFLAVVANILVNALPASVTQLDTTADTLYTLSQETAWSRTSPSIGSSKAARRMKPWAPFWTATPPAATT